jgi:hypothetical protein
MQQRPMKRKTADDKSEFLEFFCLHRAHPGSLW